MAKLALEKVLAYNKLRAVLDAGAFYAVTFDSAEDMVAINPATATKVPPAGLELHEVVISFEPDKSYGRDRRRKLSSWGWLAHLAWNEQVDLSYALESWAIDPPTVPRDDAKGTRQVVLNIRRVALRHPPRNQPGPGTEADLDIEVELLGRAE